MNAEVADQDRPSCRDAGHRPRLRARRRAELALASAEAKSEALTAAAAAMRAGARGDPRRQCAGHGGGRAEELTSALLDRLMLDEKRVEAMAKGLEEIAALPDPVGAVLAEWTRPNGLNIAARARAARRHRHHLRVAAERDRRCRRLCLKAGNAAILRGGSESFHSSRAIVAACVEGLRAAGLPDGRDPARADERPRGGRRDAAR